MYAFHFFFLFLEEKSVLEKQICLLSNLLKEKLWEHFSAVLYIQFNLSILDKYHNVLLDATAAVKCRSIIIILWNIIYSLLWNILPVTKELKNSNEIVNYIVSTAGNYYLDWTVSYPKLLEITILKNLLKSIYDSCLNRNICLHQDNVNGTC